MIAMRPSQVRGPLSFSKRTENRMDTFIDEGCEAGLVNTSGWMLQRFKFPCSAMKDVGDVDSWNKTVKVAAVKGRKMSYAQMGA